MQWIPGCFSPPTRPGYKATPVVEYLTCPSQSWYVSWYNLGIHVIISQLQCCSSCGHPPVNNTMTVKHGERMLPKLWRAPPRYRGDSQWEVPFRRQRRVPAKRRRRVSAGGRRGVQAKRGRMGILAKQGRRRVPTKRGRRGVVPAKWGRRRVPAKRKGGEWCWPNREGGEYRPNRKGGEHQPNGKEGSGAGQTGKEESGKARELDSDKARPTASESECDKIAKERTTTAFEIEEATVSSITISCSSTKEDLSLWIPALDLCLNHKQVLNSSRWVNDGIISPAQQLLKQQSKGKVLGWASPQCRKRSVVDKFPPVPEHSFFIQILHTCDSHWVTVTNIEGNTVEVHDSQINLDVSQSTK